MTPRECAEAIAGWLQSHQQSAVSGVVVVRVELKSGRIVRTRVQPPEVEIEVRRDDGRIAG